MQSCCKLSQSFVAVTRIPSQPKLDLGLCRHVLVIGNEIVVELLGFCDGLIRSSHGVLKGHRIRLTAAQNTVLLGTHIPQDLPLRGTQVWKRSVNDLVVNAGGPLSIFVDQAERIVVGI